MQERSKIVDQEVSPFKGLRAELRSLDGVVSGFRNAGNVAESTSNAAHHAADAIEQAKPKA